MDIKASDRFLSSIDLNDDSSITFQAIFLDHTFDVVEHMSSGDLSFIQYCTEFAVNFIPRTTHISVQQSLQRTQHVGKALLESAIGFGRWNTLWLFLIFMIGHKAKPGSKLLVR